MEWIQVWTIIGVLGGLFTIFSGFFFWSLSKVDTDIKSVNDSVNKWIKHSTSRMDQMNGRMDQFSKRMDQFSSRIDQLYQMFVDLLKERK